MPRGSHSWRLVAITVLMLCGAAPKGLAAGPERHAFACDFTKGLGKEWRMIGGKWELKGGCLSMTDPGSSDPTKALILMGEGHNVSSDVVITAKLRLDAWAGDDWARAGVGVCADPASGHGLNLVFHRGKLEFVHDYVEWGPGREFRFRPGEWYWMTLHKTATEMSGKAWREGEPEPADWMVIWRKDVAKVTGYPALVGCSASPDKRVSAVSFAQCEVRVGGGPFGYYIRQATWHETLAASREALARQEAELAGKWKEPLGAAKARREGLWGLLQRDFGGEALREMAAERQDNIWAEDWPFDKPAVLAERYANATRAGLAARAHELAKSVRELSDLEPVRELYYRSREVEKTLAGWGANVEALRRAVEDLTRAYGAGYPKGPQYLRQLSELRDTVAGALRTPAQPGDAEKLQDAAQRFESLRREALLSNPLLDFERLLLVKRRDARSYRPIPSFRVHGIGSGPENHLNGLPVNFQGNGVLREVPIDNEIAVLSLARAGGELTTVFRPEKLAYVGDLKLHFDADRLLFSSIGSHSRFQIFEIGVDGKGLRQVTRGEETDVDNYDSCYLADGRIVYGSSAPFQSVPCQRRHDEVANLFVMNGDGSGVRRLCFDQDHDFYPTMMSDGRVLYTRWEYTDIAHAFSARLFTMNPDGTAQRAYYASSSFWPNRIFYAKPIPDHPTKFVGIITGHHGVARAGELILFDVAKGRRQADGVVQRMPGWGKKVEAVLRDALVDGSWPKFLHPYPLSDKYFLVACQPTSQAWWGIYLVDIFDNMLLLREEEGWMLVEPVPLRPTPRPPVIPDRVDIESKEPTVYLSDIYAGEGLRGIPRGTVKKLRLFTYHFNYFGTSGIEDYLGMDGPWDVRRVLGTVPVAEDGSAYFSVPANTPIALQPLDAEGKALQLMRSWFTAMPGEAVSCIGCHEDTNTSPPVQRPKALSGEPSRIKPWHGPVRGFSWDREVQPTIDKYCVGCHDDKTPPDLRRAPPRPFPLSSAPFPPSYYALRRLVRSPGLEGDPRVVPPGDYHADTNPIVRMLRQGHQGVQLDEEAWDRLVTWLDMNAPAYGTWLEVPSVKGNPAVRHCSVRRRELLKRYAGLDDDPEAASYEPRAASPKPNPRPPTPAPQHPAVPGWPFDAEEAKRRQAGAEAEMDAELGTGVKLRLVFIPAGEFVMGDPAGCANEGPPCKVRIESPFWMGKVEVTNEQFRCFDPSHQSGVEPMLWLKWSWEDYADLSLPRQPVCRVSWEEAAAFCRWLSQKTGKSFALPSEAQWEWACRAGTDTALSFGPRGTDSAPYANLADAALVGLSKWPRTQVGFSRTERVRQFYMVDSVDDGQQVSAAVGSYRPNAWGLQDMHGNVSEWTRSACLPYPFRADDPRHAQPGLRRAVRGGSWFVRSDLARSACRASHWPWQRVFDVGFRVVCESEK
ncbi:MAG: formylglycine-generating enzyme family protein [Planctomycetes bacterium]|nr:formylglycine-generating enzyme family protein [Planctomycetota bacterium]